MKNNEAVPERAISSAIDKPPLALATNIMGCTSHIGIAQRLNGRGDVCPVYSLKDE